MKIKVMLIIIVIAVAFTSLSGAYAMFEIPAGDNRTTLEVYGESYSTLGELVESIESTDYYIGYNTTTFKWLKEMNPDNIVVSSNDSYVVMSQNDARKIPLEFATDVIIKDTIRCSVIEKRSLGESFPDIYLVKDVEFVSQDIEYLQV